MSSFVLDRWFDTKRLAEVRTVTEQVRTGLCENVTLQFETEGERTKHTCSPLPAEHDITQSLR